MVSARQAHLLSLGPTDRVDARPPAAGRARRGLWSGARAAACVKAYAVYLPRGRALKAPCTGRTGPAERRARASAALDSPAHPAMQAGGSTTRQRAPRARAPRAQSAELRSGLMLPRTGCRRSSWGSLRGLRNAVMVLSRLRAMRSRALCILDPRLSCAPCTPLAGRRRRQGWQPEGLQRPARRAVPQRVAGRALLVSSGAVRARPSAGRNRCGACPYAPGCDASPASHHGSRLRV